MAKRSFVRHFGVTGFGYRLPSATTKDPSPSRTQGSDRDLVNSPQDTICFSLFFPFIYFQIICGYPKNLSKISIFLVSYSLVKNLNTFKTIILFIRMFKGYKIITIIYRNCIEIIYRNCSPSLISMLIKFNNQIEFLRNNKITL